LSTLFVVATPLGNLEDITLRAVRVLKEADFIACEDTRTSGNLLRHLGIDKPLVAYHDHNEQQRALELASRIAQGQTCALISDAGTPLLSDPGYRLVRAALDLGVRVEPVPGPSALTAALSASGLPTDAVLFLGFLAPKEAARRRRLEEVRDLPATLVLYEAPHRMLDLLEDLQALFGDAPVVAAREITKLHEEFLRGSAAAVRAVLEARGSVRGEFTVLVGSRPGPVPQTSIAEDVRTQREAGQSEMDAIKAVAKARGIGKREVYATYLKEKG
jgi:16S rRNA (cytidine1402-2'-O)-methyltransferase